LSPDFWLGFGAAGAFCAIVGLLSVRFAARIFGTAFTELDYLKKALWHVYSYCFFCGVISNLLLAGDMYTLFYDRAFDVEYLMNGQHGPRYQRATGFSLGFLAFDLAVMLCWPRTLLAAYKKPLFVQMLIHHGISLFAWPQCIWLGRGHGMVSYLIFTETTSLFLNLHWLLREGKASGTWIIINGVCLFFSFLFVRILTIPWALWLYFSCSKETWTIYEIATSMLFVPLPPLLNLFWFKLIARGTAEKLGIIKARQPTKKNGDSGNGAHASEVQTKNGAKQE
jgi:hypothetical protein